MKDRMVEFPNRYKLVPVPGTTDQFDFVPMPGTVTEEGTKVNKANLLSDDTAQLYDLIASEATVNLAFKKAPCFNLASYMAFIANVNTTSLDSAFGKNNEEYVKNLGLQLAMYAKFYDSSIETKVVFNNIIGKNSLMDCLKADAFTIFNNINLMTLMNKSPFATSKLYDAELIPSYKRNKNVMSYLLNNASALDIIRNNLASLQALRQNRIILGTPGSVSWTVPQNFPSNFVTVALVGGGANGQTNYGGDCGEYIHFTLDVTPGQTFTGSLGKAQDTVFAGHTARVGIGATASGKLLVKSSMGSGGDVNEGYRGGSGGFEGGKGGNSSYGHSGGTGDKSLGSFANTGGDGAIAGLAGSDGAGGGGYCNGGASSGGGGGGYGGGGGGGYTTPGKGGSGIIVIFC